MSFLRFDRMKLGLALMVILLNVCDASRAQVAPATTGPGWPTVSGTLSYGLSYTQMEQLYGGSLGDSLTSVLSGEITYANSNKKRPFSLSYSGGDTWTLVGIAGYTGIFQHLSVSQGIQGRKWALNLSNDVALMPEAPVSGFSGIPGIGTLPSQPGPPVQPVLTLNTSSIGNSTSASFSYSLDALTSLSSSASYGIIRFPDGGGLESDQLSLGPQITRRMNARNSLSAQYAFTRFTYPDYAISMSTHSMLFGFQRKWNARLSTSVSAGPQWVQASASAGLPASTNLSMNASASYGIKHGSVSVNFNRSTIGGSGALTQYGATNSDLGASFSRQMGRNLSLSAMAMYMRTDGLQSASAVQLAGQINSEDFQVSLSRKLGRYFNANANYSAINQSSSTSLPANAIAGLDQVISFGIGYSPRAIHFRK